MASEWYYRVNDETLGPLSSGQLRSLAQSGTVEQDTFVWKQGLAKWVAARKIKGTDSDTYLTVGFREITASLLTTGHGNTSCKHSLTG